MRLINADELKSWLNGFIETDNISPTYIRTLIDNQPTVEAIPIEYIKKWASHWSERYWVYKDIALQIIEDWEKENGRSK